MDVTGVAWRKSSYSGDNGGNCVEVGTVWRTSSYSGDNGGACVEVGAAGPAVAVRDSKHLDGPLLALSATAWKAFTGQLKAGT